MQQYNIDFDYRNQITNTIIAQDYETAIQLLMKHPKVLLQDNTQIAFKILELIRNSQQSQLIQIAKYVVERHHYNSLLIQSISFVQDGQNKQQLMELCIIMIQKEILRGKISDEELEVEL